MEAAEKAGEQECIHNLPDGWQGRKITPLDLKISKLRYHVHTKASRFDAYCILGRFALNDSYDLHKTDEKVTADREKESSNSSSSNNNNDKRAAAIVHAQEAVRLHELALVLGLGLVVLQ